VVIAAPGCVPAAPRCGSDGPFAEPALVDENYDPALIFGLFLTPASALSSSAGWLSHRAPAPGCRSLATPAEPPQDLPDVTRMITHPASLLDQMDHPVRGPQAGFIPQRLRPAFKSALDLVELLRTQSRLASGAAGLLQPSTPIGCNSAAHLLTDCRCAPTRRATSDWLRPFASRLPARMRRRSSASKSLLIPAGNPISQLNTEYQ